MIEYSLKDNGLFCVRFIGEITSADIQKYLNDFKRLENLPRKLLTLYDLQGSNMHLVLEEIERVAKLADEVTLDFESVKTAFVVNKPDITAYAMLFNQSSVSSKKEREVFSTEESATLWLLSL